MGLHVVATAGHVDHGKSSIVRALTGTDPDRFEEEQRRGLTIDLGFAWCTLPSGRELGFVDVPGHERFVRNMLAGVGPVRLVLFVVAADEGWKPQSEEHLAILDLLGVDGAVVALSKADLVDADTLALAEAETAARLQGTALEGAPVVACASPSGLGMDALAAALDDMLAAAPAPVAGAPRVRQFIDRVFTIKGAGTVVTGTLTGGALQVGDEVEILPAGVRSRVRGLQSHKRTMDRAEPVSRVAVNLAGTEREDLRRGDVLVTPGRWLTSTVFEARVRPVRGLERPLSPRGNYKLYLGSAERDARLRFYADTGLARIRVEEPVVLDAFDRFVLRETGRQETVGGGVVLDPAPPMRPGTNAPERLWAREIAGREGLAGLLVAERGAVRSSALLPLTGTQPDQIPNATRVGDWWVSSTLLDAVAGTAERHLRAFHEAEPMREGADVAEVRTIASDHLTYARVTADPALVEALLDALISQGRIEREGALVRLRGHRATDGGAEIQQLVAAADGPTPPTLSELAAAHGREPVEAAVRAGGLVRIAPDLVVTSSFAELAERTLRAMSDAGEPITVSAFRGRLGTSRKYAVPLLEHFDRRGLTRREGDRRVLRQGT